MSEQSKYANLEFCVPVKGYEGRYEVSDKGDVYSLNYKGKGKRRKINPSDYKGYWRHILYKNKEQWERITLHRLVFMSFHNHIDISGKIIDHINRDKKDNRLENLRVVSPSENSYNRDGAGICIQKRYNRGYISYSCRVIMYNGQKSGQSPINCKTFYDEEEAKEWVKTQKKIDNENRQKLQIKN